jgi:DNA-binding winged helix-turn-helix (wHTH) protein
MTSSLTPLATDAPVCPLLKTGEAACAARFDRSLYQLALSREGSEETVDLGFSGSRVLERLLQVPGEVVSREELLSFAWEGRVVGQGSLNQQIYTLRQALLDSRSQIIQTLPRRGYLFNPQYLRVDEPQAVAPLPVSEAAEPMHEPVIELMAPVVEVAPVSARRAYRSWQSVMLAGSAMMILLGLATLGFRVASTSAPSFTHNIDAGPLKVLYVEKNQSMLDSLVKETATLVDTLVGISATPTRLIVNMSPGFYEIRCLKDNGRVNWLKVHKSQINTISSDHLQGCLR